MTNKIQWATLAIAMVWLIAGCGGKSSEAPTGPQTPQEKLATLEGTGAIPNLERFPTLEGIDGNGNGVRDDVERYILDNYATEPQRAAAMQFARAMQEALLVDKADQLASRAVGNRSSRAIHCLYSRFDRTMGSTQPAAVVERLISITTNTKERLLAYLAYSKALDGTTWSSHKEDTCE